MGAENSCTKGESAVWFGGAADTAANGSSLSASWSGGVTDAAEPSAGLSGFVDTGGDGAPLDEAGDWTAASFSPSDTSETDIGTPSGDLSLLLSAFEPLDDSEQLEYYHYDLDLFVDTHACGQAQPQPQPQLRAVERPAGASLMHAT